MKKNFSNAAEELITGISPVETECETEPSSVTAPAVRNGHLRYAEPRSKSSPQNPRAGKCQRTLL